jgi:hypothetical protein
MEEDHLVEEWCAAEEVLLDLALPIGMGPVTKDRVELQIRAFFQPDLAHHEGARPDRL